LILVEKKSAVYEIHFILFNMYINPSASRIHFTSAFTVLQESPKMPQRKSMMSRRVRPQSVIGRILIVYTSVLECVTLY